MDDEAEEVGRLAALDRRHRSERVDLAIEALRLHGGKLREAARWLGISHTTLQSMERDHPRIKAARAKLRKTIG